MAEAVIPIHISLDVVGAAVVHPGDKILLCFREQPVNMASADELNQHMQALSELLGAEVIVATGVEAVQVVKAQYGVKRNADGELEWSDNPEDRDHEQLIQREPQSTFQDRPIERVTPVKPMEEIHKGWLDLNTCRRCFRQRGDTMRPPCSSCPDYAEAVQPAPQDAAPTIDPESPTSFYDIANGPLA